MKHISRRNVYAYYLKSYIKKRRAKFFYNEIKTQNLIKVQTNKKEGATKYQ